VRSHKSAWALQAPTWPANTSTVNIRTNDNTGFNLLVGEHFCTHIPLDRRYRQLGNDETPSADIAAIPDQARSRQFDKRIEGQPFHLNQ
jgi:hypothetical protein